MGLMSVRRLIVTVCFATVAAVPHIASASVYDVAYTTTFEEGCSVSCIDFPGGLLETATFTLPDADLLTPGTYDVSASYFNPGLNPAVTPAAVADAIVAGGVLTDLTVNLNGTYPAPPLGTGSQDLTASGGTFSQSNSFSGGSFFEPGTYTITEEPAPPTPEPGTALLLGAGLIGSVAIPRLLRRRQAAGTSSQA